MLRLLRALRHLVSLGRLIGLTARADLLGYMGVVPGLGPGLRLVAALVPRDPEVARLRPGERLAWALQQRGPSFIKLGQMLSTRADLLGETAAQDLSMLQDRLPPFPAEVARASIEAALGRPLDQIFQSFEPLPVAAASVAQVHFAVTSDGRDVAVKVLRPGIAAAFARDLDLFAWIARALERHYKPIRRLKPVESVRQLAHSVAFELDLRLEAAGASELAQNFAGDPHFRVPAVDWERTAAGVLTTERIYGIPVDEREALIAAGHDPQAIVLRAAAALFAMVFRDGFFHADLHPGNLFVEANGTLAAVDFGIMGRLQRKERHYLADMLLGFIVGDYRKVAKIHFEAGYVPATKSIEDFTLAARSIGAPLLGRPLEAISVARLLAQLFRITAQFEMETQPQLLMLQKTLVMAEALGRRLAPDANMWVLVRPMVEDWVALHRSPPARARQVAEDWAATASKIPAMIDDFQIAIRSLAEDARRGHDNRGSRTGAGAFLLPLWIAALALTVLALARL